MKNLRVTIRIEESDRSQLENLVAKKKFRNLSHAIRIAIKQFLKGGDNTDASD